MAAVADGFARKAEKASGAAAEVLTASAGLAKDKGLRGRGPQAPARGRRPAGLAARRGRAVRRGVHRDGWADGRAGHGPARHRAARHRAPGGRARARRTHPEVPSVLVAEDLAPSDTAGLDPALVVALVTERGGPTSHTAIIARQLGIPCVVGVGGAVALAGGTPVLVDGTAGTVESHPDAAEAERKVAVDRESRAALAAWGGGGGGGGGAGPGRTADGTAVKILANVADGESAAQSAEAPVEGVGLFRTELCFLNRKDEPSVEEQAGIYADVLRPFRDRYVVVRTLDAGSDKPVAFATHEGEENPALGVRGLRLSFDNPALLERQLDGIAAAAGVDRHRDLGDGADGGDRRRGAGVLRAGPQPGG